MFEWKEEYSVGIDKIDKQHQKLLEIGREIVYVLDNAQEGIDQYDEIISLLSELQEYTVYHFNSEEEMMYKHDFYELGSHKFQHKMFVKKLEDIDPDKIDEGQKGFTLEILNFVANWIGNHIMKEDQKYAELISE